MIVSHFQNLGILKIHSNEDSILFVTSSRASDVFKNCPKIVFYSSFVQKTFYKYQYISFNNNEMVRILNVEEFFFSLGFIILLGSEIRVSYDSTYFVVPVFCAVKLFLAVSCRFFAANSFPPVVLFVHKQTFSF